MHAGELTYLPLLSGALAIGHRPPLRALRSMKASGVTHIVTVLSEAEDARVIGDAAARHGLAWMWIALGSTKNLPAQRKPEVCAALAELERALQDSGRIYLHCSAGIHRTGMIAAALLFYLGRSEEETRGALAALRPLTASEMGEARFEWARAFAPTIGEGGA